MKRNYESGIQLLPIPALARATPNFHRSSSQLSPIPQLSRGGGLGNRLSASLSDLSCPHGGDVIRCPLGLWGWKRGAYTLDHYCSRPSSECATTSSSSTASPSTASPTTTSTSATAAAP